ncbi:MAG: hypothetical protein ABJE95_24360 [Byssovorax sp.]
MADTRWLSRALLGAALLAAPTSAIAAPKPPPVESKARRTVLLSTVISEGGALHAPRPAEAELAPLAASLDALLADTAQDLGLALDRAPRAAPDPAQLGDAELLALSRSSAGVVILPSLRAVAPASRDVELRLSLADPSGRSLLVRSERVARDDVAVRAVVLLRDLVADLSGVTRPRSPEPAVTGSVVTAPIRGTGRPVLLVSSTLFGGFAGYSIQRASGSSDPRVLYPLLAVGAGIGLGASIIAADEWEVSAGEAWYVASGVIWPTLAGHLLYQGRFSPRVESDRWVFGLIGGTTGVTLSVLGLTLHGMSDGGALLAHSGGSLGVVFGGLTQALVRGDIHSTPFAGMGYGAGFGWLATAALATWRRAIPPSRVLAVDLGALIGGLGGAAIGSPFLLHEPDAAHQRGFLAATGGGAILGATAALFFTRGAKKAEDPGKKSASLPAVMPGIEVLGESQIGTLRAPIVGLSLRGPLR